AEVVIANAHVQSHLRSQLPIVLEVEGEILLHVVGLVDVGGGKAVRATRVTVAIGIRVAVNRRGRRRGSQQELSDTIHSSLGRYVSVNALVLEGAVRSHGLQGGELGILDREAHLEAMLAV